MSTKDERAKIVAAKVAAERNRLICLIDDPSKSGVKLASMIDSYLEIFEIYQTFYVEWKEKGFPARQKHKNQGGHTNWIKHPLAQQVEVWTDKKTKALDMLGLTAKHKIHINPNDTVPPKEINEELEQDLPKDELAAHRKKWERARGGG